MFPFVVLKIIVVQAALFKATAPPVVPWALKEGLVDNTGKLLLLISNPVTEFVVMLNALLLVCMVVPLIFNGILVTYIRAVKTTVRSISLHST